MTWIVKKRSPDGTTVPILKDDFKAAVADANEFRQAGFEAWVEDVNGKILHTAK